MKMHNVFLNAFREMFFRVCIKTMWTKDFLVSYRNMVPYLFRWYLMIALHRCRPRLLWKWSGGYSPSKRCYPGSEQRAYLVSNGGMAPGLSKVILLAFFTARKLSRFIWERKRRERPRCPTAHPTPPFSPSRMWMQRCRGEQSHQPLSSSCVFSAPQETQYSVAYAKPYLSRWRLVAWLLRFDVKAVLFSRCSAQYMKSGAEFRKHSLLKHRESNLVNQGRVEKKEMGTLILTVWFCFLIFVLLCHIPSF